MDCGAGKQNIRADGKESGVRISWYGTASILIETASAKLMFDPYMKELPAGAEPSELVKKRESIFREQDTVLITHGHFDHLSDINELYGERDCRVYLTKTPYRRLLGQGFAAEKLRLIRPGDELHFGDVSVRAYRGVHVRFDLALLKQLVSRTVANKQCLRLLRVLGLHLSYHGGHEILLYELSAAGRRIQIMGSAGLREDEDYPVGADILILPHQGRSDIDRHNMQLAERLMPKRILIDHYDDAFPPLSSQVPLDAFIDEMSKTIPTEKLSEGVTVSIPHSPENRI